jgi:hypothetical protein
MADLANTVLSVDEHGDTNALVAALLLGAQEMKAEIEGLKIQISEQEFVITDLSKTRCDYDDVVKAGKHFIWSLMTLAESIPEDPDPADFDRSAQQALDIVAGDSQA